MNQNLDFIDTLGRTIKKTRDTLGKKWIIAVSGGSDSMALLRGIAAVSEELGLEVSVAHLDHGTRAEAGRADAAFVKNLSDQLKLSFDLGHWQPARAAHFEADARTARYAWLKEIAQNRGASVIAVGHTQDDQAETILQRITRGTGLRGLSGIPAIRRLGEGIALVRPLLNHSRDELRNYLDSIKQPWREDATNADTARTRSRIRHELLPMLGRDYNPKVAEALIRLGKLARESDQANARRIKRLESEVRVAGDAHFVVLNRDILKSISRFEIIELLRYLWREQTWPLRNMNTQRWQKLATMAVGEDISINLVDGVRLHVSQGIVILKRDTPEMVPDRPEPSNTFFVPGRATWNGGWIDVTITGKSDSASKTRELIDIDSLTLPLIVDSASHGDRFDPLGMGGKTMALADFFRGRNVSLEDRLNVPVLRDQQGIVWVVGHRISHRVRITATTKHIAQLDWIQKTP